MQKDYSKAGTLEHKELDLNHTSGNGLKDYSYKASMDKVYAEYPLKSGYKDMQTRPYDTVGVQHSLTRSNEYTEHNYGKFTQNGTNYQKLTEAKIKAEQEAAEKLAASRPKVNTGKIFNKNIEEFKCVEETRVDGSIVRRYFDPYASNGKSNPMITTIDRGNYHEEIIYDPRKSIKLTYKQLGREEPEIEMTKGWTHRYTSKMYTNGNNKTYRYDSHMYNDGQSYLSHSDRGRIVVKKPIPPELQYSKYISSNDWNLNYEQQKAINTRFQEIKQEMANNKFDLMDFFRPYEP